MTDQSLFQGSEQRYALLAQRREIASDATKGYSAQPGAEPASLPDTFWLEEQKGEN